jgi:mRNA-degrading endonuclease RelE of RelBE toxin-antitoxin system
LSCSPSDSPTTAGDLKSLPKNVKNFLLKEINAKLAYDPYGHSDPLRDPLEEYRSFHCQGYRVIFLIVDDKTIAIGAVGKRMPQSVADVYRRLEADVLRRKLEEE